MVKLNILLALNIFIACNNADSQVSQNPKLMVSADIRGCYLISCNDIISGTERNYSEYHFIIELKLTNNTNSPIEFLTYSCATAANVVIDNENFDIDFLKCVNNQITTIKLEPENNLSLVLLTRTNRENAFKTIKVGWRFVDFKVLESYNNNYHEAIEQPRTKFENVLWSDPIDLKYASRNIFKITK